MISIVPVCVPILKKIKNWNNSNHWDTRISIVPVLKFLYFFAFILYPYSIYHNYHKNYKTLDKNKNQIYIIYQ